ncbi:MAG: serine hydrolase [Verrucomicrobia bacterium]|nr:serine hydrolase [Verrucomicrobiota bacterium]
MSAAADMTADRRLKLAVRRCFLCCRIYFVVTLGGFGPAAADTVFPGHNWVEASPTSQGVDAAKLTVAVEYLKANAGRDGVRELVIVRHGRLIWSGDNIDHRHGVWSCTKSFTSTVLGLLLEDGKCALDSPAAQWAPALRPHYSGVTLRHLTTMTSGYRAVGDEPRGDYRHGPSSTPFQPAPQPLFAPPGSQYAYWDSAMNLFGLVLTRLAGEPLEALFRRRVAAPIGMTNWSWGEYAKENGLVINGGSGNGDKHVFITARDLARFGLLFLNRGRWNGRQLLSERWIDQATRVQVPADMPWAQPESRIDGRGCYGCNWWVNGTTAGGQRKWPRAPASAFAALGHNNNKCVVIPDWQMVIVRLGLDQKDRVITDESFDRFLAKVGEAIRSRPPDSASSGP